MALNSHDRTGEDFILNGWNIFRSGVGDWVVAHIADEAGTYSDDEYFNRKRDAIRYAETHTPAALVQQPKADVIHLRPR